MGQRANLTVIVWAEGEHGKLASLPAAGNAEDFGQKSADQLLTDSSDSLTIS